MTNKIKSVITVAAVALFCALCISVTTVTFGATRITAESDPAAAAVAPQAELAANGWEKTPNMIRWVYGSFDSEQNMIIAKPICELDYIDPTTGDAVEAKVKFSILYGNGNAVNVPVTGPDGGISSIELDDIPVDKTADTAYGECYAVTDARIVKGLNELSVGEYILRSWVEETPVYAGVPQTDIVFRIFRAPNSWLQTPIIEAWEYGAFDPDVNVISASVKYSDTEEAISFSVTTDADGEAYPDAALEEFYTLSTGAVKEPAAAEALKNLDCGTYYLKATVKGSDNFYPMQSQTVKFKVAKAENKLVDLTIKPWRIGEFDSSTNMPTAQVKHGRIKFVITDTVGEPTVYYDNSDPEAVVNIMNEMRPGTYVLEAKVDGTANYEGDNKTIVFTVFDAENIIIETKGMPWWGVLLIVVGALAVVAGIFAILYAKGILQMLTSKMLAGIRAQADIDATIAAVRAGRITAFAQRTYEQLNAADKEQQALLESQEKERLALETAQAKEARKAARKAAALAAAARTPEEKAQIWEKKATAMKERAAALKAKAKAAEEKAAAIISQTKTPEQLEEEQRAKVNKKPRTPEEKAQALEQKAREAQEKAEALRARAEVMREIAAARAEKARAKAAAASGGETTEPAAAQTPNETQIGAQPAQDPAAAEPEVPATQEPATDDDGN